MAPTRSVVCIDPKGENACVTACTRAKKGDVWCLDPFGVSGPPAPRYNPLAWLDVASPDLRKMHRRSPTGWSTMRRGQLGEAHWNEEAKALITGIILHTVIHELPALATLATVRDKLTRDPAGFTALLTDMQASAGAYGLIARASNRQLGKSDREAAGRLLSAQRYTHFLDTPRIVDSMSASDFRSVDMKGRLGTVFRRISSATGSNPKAAAVPSLDEIIRINLDDLVLLRQGQHPFVVGKIRYYAEREFAGLCYPA